MFFSMMYAPSVEPATSLDQGSTSRLAFMPGSFFVGPAARTLLLCCLFVFLVGGGPIDFPESLPRRGFAWVVSRGGVARLGTKGARVSGACLLPAFDPPFTLNSNR